LVNSIICYLNKKYKGATVKVDELEIFNKLKIGLASDEKIREWSHGEVKKP